MSRGKYIVLEGDEGAGKTTQLGLLREQLEDCGTTVEVVREPGGDPVAEQLREILKHSTHPISPLAEVFGFSMARANMLEYVVKPKLEAGVWVLTDRSVLSTWVYQGIARGLDDDHLYAHLYNFTNIGEIFKNATLLATTAASPDLTLVIDIPLEVSQQRMASRGKVSDRFESAGEDFRRKVNAAYHRYAKSTWKMQGVNGNQSVNAVHQEIWKHVNPLLKEQS